MTDAVDANAVIRRLLQRTADLTYQNAVLEARLEQAQQGSAPAGADG